MVLQIDAFRDSKAQAIGKLSIIVPAYNEGRSVSQVVEHLLGLGLPVPFEVILVDDGSTDGSTRSMKCGVPIKNFTIIRHETNRGKGAAVLTGLSATCGTHCVIFDADDEYDPKDLIALVEAFNRPRVDVVYGSRMHSIYTRHPSLIHRFGNRFMTAFANLIYGAALTDMHTCLKMFPKELLQTFTLTQKGFGLDTEITGEMLRRGIRPFEVPVSYNGRSKAQGKKIKLSDSIKSLWLLLAVRFRGNL